MSKSKISWKRTITVALAALVIGYLVFLMVEVFWADILKVFLIDRYVLGLYEVPFLILMIGLIFSFFIMFILIMFLLKSDKETEFWIAIVSGILTFVTIIFISYISVEFTYPEVFSGLSNLDKLMFLPQYIVFFAIYVLDSPVLLWDISLVVFTVWVIIFMKLFIYEVKKRKRIKPVRERIY